MEVIEDLHYHGRGGSVDLARRWQLQIPIRVEDRFPRWAWGSPLPESFGGSEFSDMVWSAM